MFADKNSDHARTPPSPLSLCPLSSKRCQVPNVDQLDCGSGTKSFLNKFNGKPVLTGPEHVYFRKDNYVEVDVDVHRCNFFTRKVFRSAILPVVEKPNDMVFNIGVVLEGRKAEELPERMLGAVGLVGLELR
jgi:hypothetical protein